MRLPGVSSLQPRSLMGQMLLAVAAALLLVQGLGALLVYRAQREGYQSGMTNSVAFRLIAETRGRGALGRMLREGGDRDRTPFAGPPLRGFPLEFSAHSPLRPGETQDADIAKRLERIFAEQDFPASQIVAAHRVVGRDAFSRAHIEMRAQNGRISPSEADEIMAGHLLVVGVKQPGKANWMIARVRSPEAFGGMIRTLVIQTLIIYLVLVGAVALILRRMTRPLAALTRRVEQFAVAPGSAGQLAPAGPEDMQRLIVAHNAMEARIVAMLDEKDVMLGAIGHDLKTPLAALRVRIESVEDDAERGRMAHTIEDIVRTLDDILSLARVGRPSDPRERTELSALVASVVEEYEDMGEPVELADTQRIVLELRPTWLRRALRNLIDNAIRYGSQARVQLERHGERAVIRIDDDGPGIPDDEIDAMTNPFTRGDPSRNKATGGAGLGLALARAIADQHGGALVLANRLSPAGEVEGLTVRLELPLA
ncbi:sensor histidine kinase [Novosphingobium panipatense]|jgi:signal transduction histidine kinase|uniref:histidine kinase n=1 Tax=Novosphingobium panipatense TaxID=428991 RepID=A0ABY1QIM5_9SPHN|nr:MULTISPECIES: ATP-binding protein [Novosphingobium]SMP69492.1 Signal transduction histidine kinase [Novosphingobium panipatense]